MALVERRVAIQSFCIFGGYIYNVMGLPVASQTISTCWKSARGKHINENSVSAIRLPFIPALDRSRPFGRKQIPASKRPNTSLTADGVGWSTNPTHVEAGIDPGCTLPLSWIAKSPQVIEHVDFTSQEREPVSTLNDQRVSWLMYSKPLSRRCGASLQFRPTRLTSGNIQKLLCKASQN